MRSSAGGARGAGGGERKRVSGSLSLKNSIQCIAKEKVRIKRKSKNKKKK
jgi:hypothetical protein